jgi:hypothetical protein
VHLDGHDLLLGLHELAGGASQGSVDLKTLHQGGRGHQLHLRHLSLESTPALLVEENLAIELFLDLSLGPLLLLLLTARKGSLQLLLLGFLLNFRSLLTSDRMAMVERKENEKESGVRDWRWERIDYSRSCCTGGDSDTQDDT